MLFLPSLRLTRVVSVPRRNIVFLPFLPFITWPYWHLFQVYIQHVVDHVGHTLSPMAKPGVVLELAVSKSVPPIVADKRRIIQLLSNVIGNALKFTEKVSKGFIHR